MDFHEKSWKLCDLRLNQIRTSNFRKLVTPMWRMHKTVRWDNDSAITRNHLRVRDDVTLDLGEIIPI